MMKQLLLGFFFCVLVLIVSEYFFLQEIFDQKRGIVICISAIGIAFSILGLNLFYKKYRKISS